MNPGDRGDDARAWGDTETGPVRGPWSGYGQPSPGEPGYGADYPRRQGYAQGGYPQAGYPQAGYLQGGYGPGGDWGGYDRGSRGRGGGAGAKIAVALVIVLVLALLGALAYLLVRRSGGGSDTRAVVTVTSTAPVPTAPGSQDPPTPLAPVRAPRPSAVLEQCADAGSGPLSRSGRGTDVTSCAFAVRVREAYLSTGNTGGSATVSAYSPVTGMSYLMSCTGGGGVVVCRGGNNAVVYLY